MRPEYDDALVQEPTPHTTREEHMRRRRSGFPFGNPRFTWDHDNYVTLEPDVPDMFLVQPTGNIGTALNGLACPDNHDWFREDMSEISRVAYQRQQRSD